MSFIFKATNFLLYSSLFIAICSISLIQLNTELVSGQAALNSYSGFAFFATIFLYSIHRIIGIQKVKLFHDLGRFAIINKYRTAIILLGLISMIGAGIIFLILPWTVQMLVLTPTLLSLFYVLPIFPGKKRLRDFHLVKIFTIAFVWAWITSFIPEYLALGTFDSCQLISFAERSFFILAITIPFDIRDLRVDQHTKVKTIPSTIGIFKSKLLALICLLCHLVLILILSSKGYFQEDIMIPYFISFVVTGFLIYRSRPTLGDYYYSGLMDGMMILQWLLVTSWLA